MEPQQMIDYYKSMFPGNIAMGMGNAPSGTTPIAGGANALAKVALALLQQRQMQKYLQKYQPNSGTPIPSPSQGQTLGVPGGLGNGVPAGAPGVSQQ